MMELLRLIPCIHMHTRCQMVNMLYFVVIAISLVLISIQTSQVHISTLPLQQQLQLKINNFVIDYYFRTRKNLILLLRNLHYIQLGLKKIKLILGNFLEKSMKTLISDI